MSTITGKKGLSFLIFTAFLGSYILTACSGKTGAQPNPNSTATKPAATATYTPSPTPTRTPRPTPTPVYQEVQGINVLTNVYLEGDSCIPFELQGVEKCVNMFVYGESPTVPATWQGIIHVIGDVIVNSLKIEPGTEIYVAAHSDINNLQLYPGNMLEGINNTNENMNIEGVHFGEYFFDEGNHISIEVKGTLTAEGTEDQPILITSSSAEPTRWDWNSLYVNSGTISHATIEYFRPVDINGTGPVTIANNIIRHTGGACIFLANTKGPSQLGGIIENNEIYDCAHEGIGGPMGNYIIRNNVFGPDILNDLGPEPYKGNPPEIYGNIFKDSESGILFFFYEPDSSLVQKYLEENTYLNLRRKIGYVK